MSCQPHLIDEVFSRAPVYEIIFSMLSPVELVRITPTCQVIHEASMNYYEGSDLDVYAHPGHTLELLDWLTTAEGYRYQPRPDQAPEFRGAVPQWDPRRPVGPRTIFNEADYAGLKAVRDIFTFVKGSKNEKGQLKVHVMEAAINPFVAIMQTYTTCVMNLIAFDCAYALYPIPTFEKREALITRSLNIDETLKRKYVKRGWRTVQIDASNPRSRKTHWRPGVERSLTDAKTWRIPLDLTGVKIRPPPSSPSAKALTWDPVIPNTWKLLVWEDNSAMISPYEIAQSPCLRYNHVTADSELAEQLVLPQTFSSGSSQVDQDSMWLDAEYPRYYEEARQRLKQKKMNPPPEPVNDGSFSYTFGSHRLAAINYQYDDENEDEGVPNTAPAPEPAVSTPLPGLRGMFNSSSSAVQRGRNTTSSTSSPTSSGAQPSSLSPSNGSNPVPLQATSSQRRQQKSPQDSVARALPRLRGMFK